jgi:ABC-2 type transport system ATP-binding protein
VIIAKGLTKDYGNGRGIFDVSFQVAAGSCVGFLGPNGAGKTTTIRHLMGFIQYYDGEVSIKGLNCKTDQVKIQRFLGYLPGEINFFDDMRGNELIGLIAKMQGLKSLDYSKTLLQYFELNPNMKIKRMSKGMKQKLAIVIAFMGDPDIFIMDEPSSGLDPLMQQKLVNLILEHKKRGKTFFLSSHSFEEVEKTCDRILMIREGRIINDSHVETLKKEQLRKYEVVFAKREDAERFAKQNGGLINKDCFVTVEVLDSFSSLLAQLKDFEIIDISKKNLNLEEIFMKYYGD